MGGREVMKYSYKDRVMLESDIDTLLPNCYLMDEIIEFYFSYLSSLYKRDDILLVGPTTSLCLAKKMMEAESLEMSSKSVVVFVINDCFGDEGTGTHWSTLVYERSKNVFLHLDTIKNENHDYAFVLYKVVKGYMGPGGEVKNDKQMKKKLRNRKESKKSDSKPLLVEDGEPKFREESETIPQQSDGSTDCGLYVLAFAEAICREMEYPTDVLSAISTHVDPRNVEGNMRDQVSNLIRKMIEVGEIVNIFP